jgi:hypothetical protein
VADERLWFCTSCELEFSLDDENIKVVWGPKGRSCVIEDTDRRAHSLVLTTWENIQKRRELLFTNQDDGETQAPDAIQEPMAAVIENILGDANDRSS